MTYLDKLKKMGACDYATDWCASRKFKSLSQAWESCERPDWMIWLLKRTGASDRDLRLLACAFAREVLEFTGKYREVCENTISIAERYAEGKATREELDAAYAACSAACSASRRDASRSTYSSAACATHDAACAACAACDAVCAVCDVACSASWNASCATSRASCATYRAACATYGKAQKRQCDMIRERFKCPKLP